jgi:hypothetical protein
MRWSPAPTSDAEFNRGALMSEGKASRPARARQQAESRREPRLSTGHQGRQAAMRDTNPLPKD